MQRKGFVSLWAGNINSTEELDKLLKVTYTEDGDFIPSVFAHRFGIERYDDALKEVEYYNEADNVLSRLLEGFSYDDVIKPKFISFCDEILKRKYDAVILLYDFKYVDNNKTTINKSIFEFLGSVEY